MNILVADSGSTKTEWIFSKKSGEQITLHSEGLNPYFKDELLISDVLREQVASKIDDQVDKIYFYGAGCSSPIKQLEVGKALKNYFKSAEIAVESDLLGAAIACFGDDPGVACILGTGSNACIFDGEKITTKIPSLGFTLGDEGSGGHFGKQLLRAYFYETMPEDLRSALESQHNMNLDTILENVYQKPAPNKFVASFARMLADYPDHPFIKKIVKEGFSEFIDQQLGYFGDRISKMDIGFVGSIAKIHEQTLTAALTEKGFNPPAVIVQKPIEGILAYHLRKNGI
ncbi:MAG: hypothetical protein JJ895_04385 [Balneolaceae bacterium]|nr:hypothetical protein [Balneolaceae bacterium]